MRLLSTLTLSVLTVSSLYSSDEIKIHDNLFRLSYEKVDIARYKPMGLAGVHYVRKNVFDNFYLGGSVYGSLEGERGGFFAGGLELGYDLPITENLSLDAGVFAGGGTGDGKLTFGDGLMYRSHAGLNYDAGSFILGTYYSNVQFPGSQTNSNQIGFQLDIPFQTVTTTSNNSDAIFKLLLEYNDEYKFGWNDHHIAMTYQYYNPSKESFRNPSNAAPMSLIGFEYRQSLTEKYFGYLEASMAGTGTSAGYAEVMAGVGYNIPLSSNFGFNLKAALGSGGGGGVDVEGGLLYKLNAGVYFKPINNISFDFEAGYVGAPQGNFSTFNKKASFSYSIPFLTVGKNVRYIANLKNTSTQMWRFRASTQHYMASNTIRKNKKEASADLMAFKFDRFLTDNLYLTGHGFGAYKGEISGYGGGFIGFGYNTDKFLGNLSAYSELMVGVGGAGGVDAGEGLMIEPTLGLNYEITKNVDVQIGVAQVKALMDGTLNETILEAGLVYKFKTIEP